MATIINTIIAGGGGDTVNALADSSLASASVGDKVILNSGYDADTDITGLPSYSSTTNYPLTVYGQYVFGTGSSSTSAYDTYQISDEQNKVVSIGNILLSNIPTPSWTWSMQNLSVVDGALFTAFNTNRLVSSTGSMLDAIGSEIIVSMHESGYFTYGYAGSTFGIGRVKSDGTIVYGSVSYKGNTPRVATAEGIVAFGTVMKLWTIDDEGTISSQDLVSTSSGSWPSSMYPKVHLGNGIYACQSTSSLDTYSALQFIRLTKTADLTYTLSTVEMAPSVSSMISNYITLISNLGTNRFYISTSSGSGDASINTLFIISYTGNDLSTAVIEKEIDSYTKASNGYLRMTLSRDEKYLLETGTSSSRHTPTLKRLTSTSGWRAALFNGTNFIASSLTGFIKSINSDNTVDVSTVLSAGE